MSDGRANNGGKRAGAGRKPGSVSIKTRKIADQAKAEGITPIEIMLSTARELWRRAHEGGSMNTALALQACAIAKDAAPYMHARLTTIAANVTGPPVEVKVSIEDRRRKALALIEAAFKEYTPPASPGPVIEHQPVMSSQPPSPPGGKEEPAAEPEAQQNPRDYDPRYTSGVARLPLAPRHRPPPRGGGWMSS